MQREENFSVDKCEETAQWLLSHTTQRPKLAIICGSGLGMLAETLKNQESFSYTEIPNFPSSTVPGHAGQLVFGDLEGKLCVCMKGRFHMYEGYPLWKVTFPIRVFKLLGVEILIVTNAARALADSYRTGELMIIRDHINLPGFSGQTPLLGPSKERFGPHFPALSSPYDQKLRALALEISESLGYSSFVKEGVYCMVGGPNLESVAEARLLHMLGADAVGMSTAPEVLAAKHYGLRIFGLSLIVSKAAKEYASQESASCEGMLEVSRTWAAPLQTLVTELVSRIGPRSHQGAAKDDGRAHGSEL